ncbi:MAG: sulfotransferase [Paracoccaceae bacterium]
MNKGRKPDILCIGAQKAGTSWLHVTLASREDVWVPPFKELHFFDHKFIAECRRWAPWHVKQGLKSARDRHLKQTLPPDESYLEYLDRLQTAPILNGTWYKYIFSRASENQKCLDVTPEYSCIPDEGVDFFKRFLPHSKLIYIIRNPLDRLKSQLGMNAHRRKELPSSLEDWNELLEMPALQTRGDYLNHIPRWSRRFTAEQLLFLPFGRIKSDPHGTLRTIEQHCDLPPADYPHAEEKVHRTEPINIPEMAIARLNELAAPQNQFIRDHFGESFYKDT